MRLKLRLATANDGRANLALDDHVPSMLQCGHASVAGIWHRGNRTLECRTLDSAAKEGLRVPQGDVEGIRAG